MNDCKVCEGRDGRKIEKRLNALGQVVFFLAGALTMLGIAAGATFVFVVVTAFKAKAIEQRLEQRSSTVEARSLAVESGAPTVED